MIIRFFNYSACRRRSGVLNSPESFLSFFRCQKLVQLSWVTPPTGKSNLRSSLIPTHLELIFKTMLNKADILTCILNYPNSSEALHTKIRIQMF